MVKRSDGTKPEVVITFGGNDIKFEEELGDMKQKTRRISRSENSVATIKCGDSVKVFIKDMKRFSSDDDSIDSSGYMSISENDLQGTANSGECCSSEESKTSINLVPETGRLSKSEIMLANNKDTKKKYDENNLSNLFRKRSKSERAISSKHKTESPKPRRKFGRQASKSEISPTLTKKYVQSGVKNVRVLSREISMSEATDIEEEVVQQEPPVVTDNIVKKIARKISRSDGSSFMKQKARKISKSNLHVVTNNNEKIASSPKPPRKISKSQAYSCDVYDACPTRKISKSQTFNEHSVAEHLSRKTRKISRSEGDLVVSMETINDSMEEAETIADKRHTLIKQSSKRDIFIRKLTSEPKKRSPMLPRKQSSTEKSFVERKQSIHKEDRKKNIKNLDDDRNKNIKNLEEDCKKNMRYSNDDRKKNIKYLEEDSSGEINTAPAAIKNIVRRLSKQASRDDIYLKPSKVISHEREEKSAQNMLSKFFSNTNRKKDYGCLLRHAVRSFDRKKLLELLSSESCDVNEANSKGITAIHEAALDGNISFLKILILNGSDILKTDVEGFTCLDYAVLGGHFDCAAYLISNGANTDHVKDGSIDISKDTLSRLRTCTL